MKDMDLITNNIEFKEAFGSFEILDDIDPMDHPQIYRFARIISNYLKLQRINEERDPD